MWNSILGYDFFVVAFGTLILAVSSAIVGSLSVYKGQSLMGDAVGHSTYPGVVLAFILMKTRNPFVLMIGAVIIGAIAYFLIQVIEKNSSIGMDASLAIVLSGFFGLGMVLKSYVQGNPHFADASQAGLKNYIFGSAAFMMKIDVYVILGFSIMTLMLFFIFKRALVITIFDKNYAKSVGIPTGAVEFVLLLMTIIFIALGLKSVGAILIASFLVFPCIFANQCSKNLSTVLFLSSIMAGVSAFIGTFISTQYRGISTGPMIILCMATFVFIAILFGKYSFVRQNRMIKRKKV